MKNGDSHSVEHKPIFTKSAFYFLFVSKVGFVKIRRLPNIPKLLIKRQLPHCLYTLLCIGFLRIVSVIYSFKLRSISICSKIFFFDSALHFLSVPFRRHLNLVLAVAVVETFRMVPQYLKIIRNHLP